MIVHAPFTPEQVENLNEWQFSAAFHPFTCPNRGDAKHLDPNGLLFAKIDGSGWCCEYCDYTQDWAHDFMADGSGVRQHRETIEKLKAARTATR